MDVLQKVLAVLLSVISVIAFALDIGLFISWAKAKERAFIGNWVNIVWSSALSLGLCLYMRSLAGILLLVTVILVIPVTDIMCLSPEGVRVPVFISGGISPVGNHSYEYKKNSLGMETLCIYNKNSKKGMPYNLGIKSMKTVKMLADWYGKHGYDNPLTK